MWRGSWERYFRLGSWSTEGRGVVKGSTAKGTQGIKKLETRDRDREAGKVDKNIFGTAVMSELRRRLSSYYASSPDSSSPLKSALMTVKFSIPNYSIIIRFT